MSRLGKRPTIAHRLRFKSTHNNGSAPPGAFWLFKPFVLFCCCGKEAVNVLCIACIRRCMDKQSG